MDDKVQRLIKENEKLSNNLSDKEKQLLDARRKIEILHKEIVKYREFEGMYNTIANSTTWRMTRPVRLVLDKTKELLAKNDTTWLMYKGLRYLKNYGLKNTIQKVKTYSANKNIKNNINYDISNFEHINLEHIEGISKCDKKIAVHIHLYYVDLLEEFSLYLENIPYKFDIFVSTKEEKDIQMIINRLKKIKNTNNVDVRKTINRGRDIAPFYVQFREELIKYDYVLHVHSKKSLFTGKEQYGWRQYSLDCLLGSKELVSKIFALFENDKENKFGLFYPEIFEGMSLIANSWLQNTYHGQRLLEKMGIKFESGFFNYPVGSFFWAKVDAIKPLFDLHLTYEDFPEEAAQTDGTIAHALERVISFVVRENGYKSAIYDIRNNIAFVNNSLKAYQGYFTLTKEEMLDCLIQYDIVTFDIFDTLITRKILRPDDLFRIMGVKIKAEYGLQLDYLSVRKQSEAIATEEKGAFCNIHDIYKKMNQVIATSDEMLTSFKNMEVDLELELCTPREEVLWVFNRLKEAGKKIILLSDMYLTSEIIELMLGKCGYDGYDELVVSCEAGIRKDQGTMWDDFFFKCGEFKTIHVGDNVHSDIQLVIDRSRDTFYVINPFDAFKLSNLYCVLGKYIGTTISNSLLLGMLINAYLFNSPFSQNQKALPCVNNYERFGKVAFGIIFTSFIKYIADKQNGEELWFLAREGFLFKEMYDKYCVHHKLVNNSKYFLASRRAASVASINDINDVKEILCQFYDGGIKNLFKSRLGIEDLDMDDFQVKMPEDIDKAIEIASQYKDMILAKSQKEKKAYINYISNISSGEKVSVVDVGYSGTIQYYLSKLTNEKIAGYYMITSDNIKPEREGCKSYSIYKHNDIIFNKQLFFEAVLKAPYGQLMKFDLLGNCSKPVYKNDNEVSSVVIEIQNGILNFENDYLNLSSKLNLELDFDKNFVEDVCVCMLSDKYVCAGTAFTHLYVQDDYCSNADLVYKEGMGWVKR